MGIFLSLSGVIGKTQNEVVNSLTDYAKSAGGGLPQENIDRNDDNFCVIEEANGNTTVFYPYDVEWDASSAFLSKELKAPVFSFHIHDDDLWMYILYFDEEIVDQFNLIPDYWDASLDEKEIESWKGNAAAISKYVPAVKSEDITNYLVHWDLDTEERVKAYPDDKFCFNDAWQLLDVIKKLGLPYPLADDDNPKGRVYKFWTNDELFEEE